MMTQHDRDYERLRWRCRRGLLELDLLLQDFLQQDYAELDAAGKSAFERLLQIPDNTLLAYWQGTEHCNDREVMRIVKKLR